MCIKRRCVDITKSERFDSEHLHFLLSPFHPLTWTSIRKFTFCISFCCSCEFSISKHEKQMSKSNNTTNNNTTQPHKPNNSMEVKQEDGSHSNGTQHGPPSSIKAYQDGQKQQLQSANYASACQWVCK
jgi:hypothetical protein